MRTTEEAHGWPEASGLPDPPDPVGAYRAVVIRGGLGFVSGQFPLSAGMMVEAAEDETPDMGTLKHAAGLAARNVVAQILKALGSWDRFAGLCRVDGIVAVPGRFTKHAAVLDAASEAFVSLLGPVRGAHARSATSAPSLPGNAAIELVVTFAVAGD